MTPLKYSQQVELSLGNNPSQILYTYTYIVDVQGPRETLIYSIYLHLVWYSKHYLAFSVWSHFWSKRYSFYVRDLFEFVTCVLCCAVSVCVYRIATHNLYSIMCDTANKKSSNSTCFYTLSHFLFCCSFLLYATMVVAVVDDEREEKGFCSKWSTKNANIAT